MRIQDFILKYEISSPQSDGLREAAKFWAKDNFPEKLLILIYCLTFGVYPGGVDAEDIGDEIINNIAQFINDEIISPNLLWSSEKIDTELSARLLNLSNALTTSFNSLIQQEALNREQGIQQASDSLLLAIADLSNEFQTNLTNLENSLTLYINNHVDALQNSQNALSAAIDNLTILVGQLDLSSDLANHTNNTLNPHNVTKEQIGLGNVLNEVQLTFADVVDQPGNDSTNLPVSANQVKLLNDAVSAIQTILNSNTVELDTIQEIVDFIQNNRDDIETILLSKEPALPTGQPTGRYLHSDKTFKQIDYSEIANAPVTIGGFDFKHTPIVFGGDENSRIRKTSAILEYPKFYARINETVFEFPAGTLDGTSLDTGSFPVNSCADYHIFAGLDGLGDPAIRISLSKTTPSGLTFPVMIGGFHYGVERNSLTVGDVVLNSIVSRSIWTRKPGAMPSCYLLGLEDPALYDCGGMIEVIPNRLWMDIYLVSDPVGLTAGGSASNRQFLSKRGYSRYAQVPLTGTENLNYYDFVDRARTVGKRLPNPQEWTMGALGAPPGRGDNNTNGWTASINTQRVLTGALSALTVPAGYSACSPGDGNYHAGLNTSLLGLRDTTGNIWEWCDGMGNRDGTSWAWRDVLKAGESSGLIDFGQEYSGEVVNGVIMGGDWHDGVFAGSRAVIVNHHPWHVYTFVGGRFACDTL